jgi:type I restriction enzyme S subunit
MKSNWSEVSIEELKAPSKNAIAMGPFGSRIKVENFVEDGVPVIKGGNLTGDFIVEKKFDFLTEEKADELKASNAFRRDIVITHRGTIGQVGIIPDNSKFERYVVSQSQLKVTLDQEKINPYFVYYFLRSPVGQHRLLINTSQVGVPAIAQASTSVKGIMIPCPEKRIQDKVVEIILSLDYKIHINRQINQTLEAMAQAIFKSWFVDFEPVKAKIAAIEAGEAAEDVICAAMRAISGKTDDELDQLQAGQPEHYAQLKTTAELFPSAMQDSELGEVPEGMAARPSLYSTVGGMIYARLV